MVGSGGAGRRKGEEERGIQGHVETEDHPLCEIGQTRLLQLRGKMNAAAPLPEWRRTSYRMGKFNPKWLGGTSPPSPRDGEPGSMRRERKTLYDGVFRTSSDEKDVCTVRHH